MWRYNFASAIDDGTVGRLCEDAIICDFPANGKLYEPCLACDLPELKAYLRGHLGL